MSELLVPEDERGIIRVFALTEPPEEMNAQLMARALGIDYVDMSGIELFPVSDLAGIGIEGYLTEGLGAAPEAVVPGTLDGIGDYVAIVHSAAFAGQSLELDPRPPLQLAVVFREYDGPAGDLMPLTSAAASGQMTADEMDPMPPRRTNWWLIGIGAVIGFILAFSLVFLGTRG